MFFPKVIPIFELANRQGIYCSEIISLLDRLKIKFEKTSHF